MKSHPYLFLAAIFALLFLAGNELAAVTDTAESNYALTAREMVLSGDWMSPRIYGHYWYDKPIFFYWELALSFADFGFNEFAARLPSAVFGVASVLYTFWFSSKVYDRKTGWTAALILGTSLEFWLLSKAVVTDAALFFFMSVSIAFTGLGEYSIYGNDYDDGSGSEVSLSSCRRGSPLCYGKTSAGGDVGFRRYFLLAAGPCAD